MCMYIVCVCIYVCVCVCVCICLIWSYKLNNNDDHYISCLGGQTEVAMFQLLFNLLLSSCSPAPYPILFPCWFSNITSKLAPCVHPILKKPSYSVKLVQRMWHLRDVTPKGKHPYALISFWFPSFVYFY